MADLPYVYERWEQITTAEGLPDDVVERYRRLCPMAENSTGLYRYVVKRQP